jgi:hypothetical protein
LSFNKVSNKEVDIGNNQGVDNTIEIEADKAEQTPHDDNREVENAVTDSEEITKEGVEEEKTNNEESSVREVKMDDIKFEDNDSIKEVDVIEVKAADTDLSESTRHGSKAKEEVSEKELPDMKEPMSDVSFSDPVKIRRASLESYKNNTAMFGSPTLNRHDPEELNTSRPFNLMQTEDCYIDTLRKSSIATTHGLLRHDSININVTTNNDAGDLIDASNWPITMVDYDKLAPSDLKYDKRSFCTFFIDEVTKSHTLLSLINKYSIIDSVTMRVIKYIQMLHMMIAFNAILYSDSYINMRVNSYDKLFNLNEEMPRLFGAMVISSLIFTILKLIVLVPGTLKAELNAKIKTRDVVQILNAM